MPDDLNAADSAGENLPGESSPAHDTPPFMPEASMANLDDVDESLPDNTKATKVRYSVIGISVLMAFMLYLDRVSIGEIVKLPSFLEEFDASKERIGEVLGAFFFTYAFFQVPAGWLSDRFGSRKMLAIYIVAWSVLTALTGWVYSLTALLIARLAFGAAQAGAYSTSSGIIRKWINLESRSIASGWVAMGGRLGGALAPLLTTALIVWLDWLNIVSMSSWRVVLIIYGAVGLLVAVLYYWIVRDKPSLHPGTNAAERKLIGVPPDDVAPTLADFVPMLIACCQSRTLWLNSIVQFLTNVGWVFLIAWLPTYLFDVKGVGKIEGARMVTIVLSVGIIGQLLGGWMGDWCVRTIGLRWGRVIPVALTKLVAAAAYIACVGIDSAWGIVICCATVSFMTDVANPSFWALTQDIGGRNSAGVFAWANMWGNFGAAASAILTPRLETWSNGLGYGYDLVFYAYGLAFLLSAFATIGMDPTRLVQEPLDTEPS